MGENVDFKEVNISEIDLKNRQYQISYPPCSPDLTKVLHKTGVINPVFLLSTNPYVVIDGFKRLTYASKIGKNSISAFIMEVPPDKALKIAIYENLMRGLNIVEKAIAVSKMFDFRFSRNEIVSTIEDLGLGKSEKILDLCRKIANETETAKTFFVNHSLSLKTIDYFLNLTEESKKTVITFLEGKKVTESLLREFMRLVLVLEIRFGKFSKSNLVAAETLEDGIKILKKIVSPELSTMQEEFEKVCKKMELPPSTKVRVDPFFEREEIEILIRAKRKSEIECAILKLEQALRRGDFDKILELTGGNTD